MAHDGRTTRARESRGGGERRRGGIIIIVVRRATYVARRERRRAKPPFAPLPVANSAIGSVSAVGTFHRYGRNSTVPKVFRRLSIDRLSHIVTEALRSFLAVNPRAAHSRTRLPFPLLLLLFCKFKFKTPSISISPPLFFILFAPPSRSNRPPGALPEVTRSWGKREGGGNINTAHTALEH